MHLLLGFTLSFRHPNALFHQNTLFKYVLPQMFHSEQETHRIRLATKYLRPCLKDELKKTETEEPCYQSLLTNR